MLRLALWARNFEISSQTLLLVGHFRPKSGHFSVLAASGLFLFKVDRQLVITTLFFRPLLPIKYKYSISDPEIPVFRPPYKKNVILGVRFTQSCKFVISSS